MRRSSQLDTRGEGKDAHPARIGRDSSPIRRRAHVQRCYSPSSRRPIATPSSEPEQSAPTGPLHRHPSHPARSLQARIHSCAGGVELLGRAAPRRDTATEHREAVRHARPASGMRLFYAPAVNPVVCFHPFRRRRAPSSYLYTSVARVGTANNRLRNTNRAVF
jgi:hypothetical protein